MTLLLDHAIVATAYDAEFTKGQVGYSASGCAVEGAFVQPIAPVDKNDDFMRTGATGNPWTTVSGTWQYRPLREELPEKADPTRSANAFSYQGQAKEGAEPAICVWDEWKAEEREYKLWFWDDYRVELSVRPQGSAVGAIFNFQDPQDYCLLRWTSETASEGGKSQLIQVRNGERTVVAEQPGGYLPDYWAAVSVTTYQGVVSTMLDGKPGPSGTVAAPAEGGVGLYVEPGGTAFFDDAVAKHWEAVSDDFSAPEPGKWLVEGAGGWSVAADGTASASPKGVTRLVTGDPAWQDYTVAVDVRLAKGAAGVLAYGSPAGAYVLRMAAKGAPVEYAGQVEIARIEGEMAQRLAAAPLTVNPDKWHQLRLTVDDGYLAGYVDDARVLEAGDTTLTGGQFGLYAEAKGQPSFDNAQLRFEEDVKAAEILAQFVEPGDLSMVEWATPRGQWLIPANPATEPAWHKGAFFGDKTVAFSIPAVGGKTGSVVVLLEPAEDATKALRVELSTAEGERVVSGRLLQGEQVLAEGRAEVAQDSPEARVEIAKRGQQLLASVNGRELISYEFRL
jgi:hypothetical protein